MIGYFDIKSREQLRDYIRPKFFITQLYCIINVCPVATTINSNIHETQQIAFQTLKANGRRPIYYP